MSNNPIRLNRSIPIILSLLLLLTFAPLIAYPSSWFHDQVNGSGLFGILYWTIIALFYCVYAILVFARNHATPPLRYALMFLWVLLYSILVMFLHEKSIVTTDTMGQVINFELSWDYLLVYDLRLLYSLFFAFAFLFVWGYGKKEPRYRTLLPYTVVLIGLASLVFAFLSGPDPAFTNYPHYTSFYDDDEVFSKVMFVSTYCALVLAYEYRNWTRYLFLGVATLFLVMEGYFALAMAFWCTLISFALILLYFLFDRHNPERKGGNLPFAIIYFAVIGIFVLLVLIPSDLATALRPRLGAPIVEVIARCSRLWRSYLDTLSGPQLLWGDGPLGYFRSSVMSGSALFQSPGNGPLEVYNAGGVVYLLFYLLLIIVAFVDFRKREGSHSFFFSVVVGFTCTFLFYTVFSTERLLFSYSFISFVVAYLFTCYPGHQKEELRLS